MTSVTLLSPVAEHDPWGLEDVLADLSDFKCHVNQVCKVLKQLIEGGRRGSSLRDCQDQSKAKVTRFLLSLKLLAGKTMTESQRLCQ